MQVIVKVKKIVGTREFNDKTGEQRKVTTVVAEEVTNDAYKDSYVIEFWDKFSAAFLDNRKEGDKIKVSIAFRAQARSYKDKEGHDQFVMEQKVSGFNTYEL